ncbi:MAG: DUF4124 domain-containing protein [Gammaproteobacteria bacterium]|nr:DUF4124 domain-containing protein [Gammaproteobacteria bacterium]
MTKKHYSILILSLTLATSSGVYGALYKWVDSEGNTHFGDAIPAEYVKEKYQEMSKSGIVTTTHQRTKTEQEIRKAEEQKALEARLAKERLAKKNIIDEYDRILLDTYLTEKDLSRTKDRRIATIGGTIRLTKSNIDMLNKTVHQLKKEVEEDTDNKKIRKQLKMAKAQLLDYENFISKKKREQNEIRTRFDQDIKRFRTLKGFP